MTASRLRIVSAFSGVAFALQGIVWLVDPQRMATALGMPLLEGMGRSTQIGDFAAFFLTLGLSTLAGLSAGRAGVLYVPAGLLGLAAFGRFIAWAMHGAAFATLFILVEIAASALLVTTARRSSPPP